MYIIPVPAAPSCVWRRNCEERTRRAMAQKYDRRRYGYTDGSLAYDLDALARERALEEAGRVEEDRREPAAAP